MRKLIAPTIPKWPFLAGDALLLALAAVICVRSESPMSGAEIFACVACVALGAGLAALPFFKEFSAVSRLAEAESLTTVVSQIHKVEQLTALIGSSTAHWQTVQEAAGKTAGTAKEIAERMAAEVKAFNEFLQRANEGEKAGLRLETEKLRRAEAEWLQVIVRMLDHTFALHRASLESRQPHLIEQLSHFQNALRDAARRVGLAPVVAGADEPFDEKRHQLIDGEAKPDGDAAVGETLMSGYTFQGRLLRPALVRLRNGTGAAPPEIENGNGATAAASSQSQLPLAANS